MSDVAVGAPQAQAAPQKRKRISDRARAERRLAYMLCAPAVIVMLAVTAWPVLAAVWPPVHPSDLRFPDKTAWVGLDNYIAGLGSSKWWADVGHTVIIIGVSVSIELV